MNLARKGETAKGKGEPQVAIPSALPCLTDPSQSLQAGDRI